MKYPHRNNEKKKKRKLVASRLAAYMANQENVEIDNAINTLNRIHDMKNETNHKT